MKKDFVLVLVLLLAMVLVSDSCTRVVIEAPPATETETEELLKIETTQIVMQTTQPLPEPKPASFNVSGLTITPKEVAAGSSVVIEALVTNTGELPGTHEVTLKIDDTVEGTEKINLEGGGSQKVTFSVLKSTAKTYSVSINGQSGTFMVQFPTPSPTTTQSKPLPPLNAFMKGIHFNDWDWDIMPRPPLYGPLYYPPQADSSLKKLAATGANWISILVFGRQETVASTIISRDQYATALDEALQHVIDLAHSLGMRVVLLPALYKFSNDPDHTWIQIGTAFTNENQWREWFASYREFINHYASFAQEAGVDFFHIGSELCGTTHREDDWRRIIKEVRERFNGLISYDSLGGPVGDWKRIKWWDAVDYIATDVWYILTNKNDPTIEELRQAWIQGDFVADLENFARKFDKPFIISEIGYQARDGTNKQPWVWNTGTPIDELEQADCYQVAFEMVWGKSWLKGIFWYQWYATTVITTESPQGRPAEEVIKQYYLSK